MPRGIARSCREDLFKSLTKKVNSSPKGADFATEEDDGDIGHFIA